MTIGETMKYNKLHVLASYYKADNITKLAIIDHFKRPMISDTFMKGLAAEELGKWYLNRYVGLDVKTDEVQDYIYDYKEPNRHLSELPDCYIDGIPCDVKQSYNFMQKALDEGAWKVVVVENFNPICYQNVLITIVDLRHPKNYKPKYNVNIDIVEEFMEWLKNH